MIALKITNKKVFMAKLLASDVFDSLQLEEAVIDTYNTFTIDGHIHKEFYKNDENSETAEIADFSQWADLRSFCFELIKGKRTPLGFKFIFHPDNETKSRIIRSADTVVNPDDVLLGLNIRFHNGEITITTGTAFKIFSLDKTIEKTWDEYIPGFLSKSDIDFEYYEF